MKIFILEDSYNREKLFREALLAHNVTLAETYKDGISKFAPPYDVILLDRDLADDHQRTSEKADTGEAFVDWLVENHKPHGVTIVHSYNFHDGARMVQALAKAGWVVNRQPFGLTLLDALRKL